MQKLITFRVSILDKLLLSAYKNVESSYFPCNKTRKVINLLLPSKNVFFLHGSRSVLKTNQFMESIYFPHLETQKVITFRV